MSQFSKKWIVLLVLVIPLVFVSQVRAQHTPPDLCDDGSVGRFYSECCECNLAQEIRECPEGDKYKYGSCTHENPAACSYLCEGVTPTPACNSSPACDSGCCSGIEHGYGATGYSRCTSLPSCSNDPDCGNIEWNSDVCRGNLAQGEYCRLCEGNYSEQVTRHLSGEDCNAPCDAIDWMEDNGYTQAQIATITNHCYIEKVMSRADRTSYPYPDCIKIQRDAGNWRGGTWDYLCHHFDEGGKAWPECVPLTNTPTPTNTPSPSPTPVEIAISGKIYCQDPDSSTSYPIKGAWLLFSYATDIPVIYNLRSDVNGDFSTVMIDPDQRIPFELKHPRLDASGKLSNGQPYSSLIGPTGNNIEGCSFVGETTDSDPVYTCNIKSYNNLDFKYTNCQPQVLYPQCQDIEARNRDNPLGPAIDPINLGEYVHQQVQFACLSSYPELVSRYEFRVIKRSSDASLAPEIIPLEVADPTNPDYKNISALYTINRGQYAVQCRICTKVGLGEEVCQPWDWDGETIPWPEIPAPTSIIPSPSLDAQQCLPSDCGKQEFQCVATHSLQCQLDPLGKCSWQCIPIDKTKTDAP